MNDELCPYTQNRGPVTIQGTDLFKPAFLTELSIIANLSNFIATVHKQNPWGQGPGSFFNFCALRN